ncbi:MAG: PQQ-binding-like beta-propeller repeat protein [Bacteroidales bacterium]|nr:PQQ-binding-like beta-propeller repeat protein [Bacteroidales bacterium]
MVKKIALMFFTGLMVCSVYSQESTKWRGPNANGIYPETGLMKQWPAEGPKMLWNTSGLGQGYSSPVFADGKIFVSGALENTGYIFVMDEAGKIIAKYSYGEEFVESYPGSRSSPTIAGNLLYMLSGIGKLVCMDIANGQIKWEKDVFKEFDGANIRWGITETLLVEGDKIFCAPGGTKNNVIALNRFTGELIWSCAGKGEVSAYCSPILVKLPKRDLLVTMMANHILGIDAKTGTLLWSYPQTNRWSVHANTPIFSDGSLYCFSGYGQGGVKLKLNEDGTHGVKEWFNSSLDSRMGGAVLMDGYIYGSGDNNRQWFCIDWKTGENKYASSDFGKGVVVAADGMLFCYSENGEIALVEANSAAFKILGRMKITLGSDQHWAHPVIKNGILYVRHGDTLMAYKIK